MRFSRQCDCIAVLKIRTAEGQSGVISAYAPYEFQDINLRLLMFIGNWNASDIR